MAALSNYLSIALQRTMLGQAQYTMPTTIYLALTTTVPTAATVGTEVTTGGYTGYTRVSLGASGADFPTPTTTSTANTTAITFPACTGGSGVTIAGFEAYDALTGGNPLWWGTCSLQVSNGITPAFGAGALTLGLT